MRPCKAKCIQQSFPLQFCVIDRKLNGICLVEKFHQFTKKKKKTTTNNPATNMQASCYFVSTSYFINFFNQEAQ